MAERASDRRLVAAGIWVCLRSLGVPLGRGYPKRFYERAILDFAQVGTVQSVNEYLRLMEVQGLVERKGGTRKGTTVVLRDPDRPVPYWRPPGLFQDPDVLEEHPELDLDLGVDEDDGAGAGRSGQKGGVVTGR